MITLSSFYEIDTDSCEKMTIVFGSGVVRFTSKSDDCKIGFNKHLKELIERLNKEPLIMTATMHNMWVEMDTAKQRKVNRKLFLYQVEFDFVIESLHQEEA